MDLKARKAQRISTWDSPPPPHKNRLSCCGHCVSLFRRSSPAAMADRPAITFVTATEFSSQRSGRTAVVDVRDEERITDGHIVGSLHYPSGSFEDSLSNLAEDLKGRDTVVFHCAKSQVRGPTCAGYLADYLYKQSSEDPKAKVPKIVVLDRGYDGWAAAGRPVCNCLDVPCQKHKPSSS